LIVMLASTKLNSRPAVAHYPPGATYGPRRIDDFELVWMLSGSARWRRTGADGDVTLRYGDALLIRPGTHDEFQWDQFIPSRHGYVHFHFRRPDPGMPQALSTWPLLRTGQIPGPLAGLLDYLLWLGGESAPGWRDRAEDILSSAVRAFVSGPLPETDLSPEMTILTTGMDYVRQAWTGGVRPVSLGEVAAACSTSTGHLARLFRARYGCGLVTALERIRLSQACMLLSRTNLTVSDVARASGWANPLHFSRRFHAHQGCAPRDFRQQPLSAELDPASLNELARRLLSNGGPGAP
jgi:AraC family transcriptional regulator